MRVRLGILLITLLCPTAAALPGEAVEARKGMAVAAEPLAARAGIEILEMGGNAIDAAVAVGFALAVTYPAAGNIGGGGFLVASLEIDGKRRNVAIDFREKAPLAGHARMYVDAREAGRRNASTLGHLAAGVPGSVAGLLLGLERYGTLDRATVMAPAIRLARDGFSLAARTRRSLASQGITARMRKYPETVRIFYPGGTAPAEGAMFVQSDLARTLERIATEGRDGFYKGPVARAVADEMKRGGGLISERDMELYRAIERDAVEFQFKKHTVISMPPPSSGGVCLQQMLGVLERHPLEKLGHNSTETLHLLGETMRRSFADRNRYLGDPDYSELPLERLLSDDHIARMAGKIDRAHATPSSEIMGTPPRESEQTTHYSVVDEKRNAVAVTTTLNGAFGCMVVAPGTGFLLNNEMDDFTAEPGKPNLYGLVQGEVNAVEPGKRPLSSMAPTVVLDEKGRPVQVLGTPGGPTIITNVLQVFLNLLVFGLEPQAAVDAPKIHHQCVPDRLSVEKGVGDKVRGGLKEKGHELRERGGIGDFQLIVIDWEKGVLLGASDGRGGGAAVGY